MQLRLWNLNSISNSPVAPRPLSGQIPASQCEAERAQMQTNIEKHVPRVMMSLQMSSPPISISHQLFLCGYSNSRDVVASSPSFSHPAVQASPRACSQARPEPTCKPPSLQPIALPRNKTPHSPTVKQMQTRDCKT